MMEKTKKSLKTSWILFLFIVFINQFCLAQAVYISSGSEFFLKNNTNFTTSNSIITVASSGFFSIEAGSTWGSASEFVDGEVLAYGSGDTKLPVGDNGVYQPVTASHNGNIVASYHNTNPDSGSLGSNIVDISDIEYWQLSGNAVITLPWNDSSGITGLVNDNGSDLNALAIVGLGTGEWNLVSASQTFAIAGDLMNGTITSDKDNDVSLNDFSQFTFGIDQEVLAVDDLILAKGINILSNPIGSNDSRIQFTTSEEMNDLKVSLFDIMGRGIHVYNKVSTSGGIGDLSKPNVKSGIYLLKFEHEGKQGIKKIIIE